MKTELGRLRRALDPDHPDPERLRQRVRSAMTSTQTPDSLAEQDSTSIRGPDIRSRVRAHAPFRSIPHVSTLVATITVLIVIVVAAVGVFHESGERQITAGSTPVSPASSPKQSSTTPLPSIPDGFRDCSAALGAGSYCVETPECWTGVRSYADSPMRADRAGCNSAHYYETFAAGFLAITPLRQSELQAMPEVKRVVFRAHPRKASRLGPESCLALGDTGHPAPDSEG